MAQDGSPPTSHAARAESGAAPAARGSLLIMGGAVREDTADIWQRLVQAAGGPGARVLIIPAASSNPKGSAERIAAALARYGAQGEIVPLSPRWPDGPAPAAVAEDAQWVQRMAAAGGVFFTGGEQSRITGALVRADGRPSALFDAIWALYRRGGVVAGTSAGAAVMSRTMFYEPADGLELLLAPRLVAGRDDAAGLGFIGPGVFVDQHMIARGRFARMLRLMHERGIDLGLGVDENSAAWVHGGVVEVLGASGVLVADTRVARSDARLAAFNLRGARMSYLERGDRFELARRSVQPSPWKRAGRLLDPHAPDYRPEFGARGLWFDALGRNVALEAMSYLLDSSMPQVRALALGQPGTAQAGRGFEFTFAKGAGTHAWLRIDQGTAFYTLVDIDVSIVPIELPVPLYRPLPPADAPTR